MGGYKIGVDRKQLTLLPVCLDEYVPEDHICRVIDAFTRQLDMFALGYKYAEYKDTGCRPYDPKTMLNLYIYGYLHRTRSSRRLRDEARRNIEVIWLMEGLTPDDKTICNFRKDNRAALKGTFLKFVQMCRRLGLYGEEVEAVDGTKVRADNSLKHHYNGTVVKNELERVERKIEEYMEALEDGDKADAKEKEPGAEEIRAALEELKERKEKYKVLKERINEEGEISTVDSEARLMRSGGDGRKLDIGYNVQTVVDGKYHMVVDFEVTSNSGDTGYLHEMSERAKEILEVEALTSLADKGYYDSEDIAACEANGVTCLVAKRSSWGNVKGKEFGKDNFVYDCERDVYVCPCKNVLERRCRKGVDGDGKARVYANYGACGKCPRRAECTKYKYREMWRHGYQDVMDMVDERTRGNKELYQKRKEIVEHVFGTVKAVWGYRQYLCRGKEKATAETTLIYLAYNIRRAVNIFKESRLVPVFR